VDAQPQSQPQPKSALARAWSALFTGRPAADQVWVWVAVLAALYLGGIVFWGVFFHWGDFPYKFHDWAEVNAARIAFVRDAVIRGQLPLHMPDSSALRGLTDRFLVLPDVITAPQMVLMAFMSVTQFFFVDVLLMYTLGTLGLLWFKRKYALSPAAFTFLFLAFQFNGHIQAHLSVGHATWLGYFLLPWFVALVIQLIEGAHAGPRRPGFLPEWTFPGEWRWIGAMAFLLFFMLLQGSFHQFIWCLMFLGLVGIAVWRRLWTVLKAGLLTGLLSAVRLLPPALGLGQFNNDFLSGYPRPWDLLNALVKLIGPAQAYANRMQWHGLGWWEYDLYLGLAGTLLLAFFGVWMWLVNLRREKQYWQLLPGALVLALLSQWQVFKPIMSLPIPFFAAERVSSRMIIIPFAIALTIAAINLQRWLDGSRRRYLPQAALLVLLGALGWNLVQHLRLWQETAAVNGFPYTDVDLAIKVVANHPDPAYFRIAGLGAALTLVVGIFLVVMVLRERRQAARQLAAEVK
jgi:hypothetical protein